MRLDVFLARRFPLYSRARLRRVIHEPGVEVDGMKRKASYRLNPGNRIELTLPDPDEDQNFKPENIPLDIIYEDEYLAVVDKPPGMVVHPAKGHWSGTLVSGLAYHFRHLSSVGGPTRPGADRRLFAYHGPCHRIPRTRSSRRPHECLRCRQLKAQ